MHTMTTFYVAVIDDDDGFRHSMARLLRAAGYQPVTYASAEDFLADATQPRFGCILLDIALGGMSGIEFARHLEASGSGTPIIYVTAHDDPQTRAAAGATRCAGFVSKVESNSGLLGLIRALPHG